MATDETRGLAGSEAGTSKAGAGAAPDGAPAPDKVSVMGQVVWLMTQSPAHRNLLVSDFEWLVLPPIAFAQFRLWRERNMPVAFASWAYLSEEVEDRLKGGPARLRPEEWRSGDRLWLMDLVAPFGAHSAAIQDLRYSLPGGDTLKVWRRPE